MFEIRENEKDPFGFLLGADFIRSASSFRVPFLDLRQKKAGNDTASFS